MELTAEYIDIMNGLTCPYCKNKSELVSSELIYRRDYGKIYLCKPCNAYVGCHHGTEKALGRLANKELRELKKAAHEYFDKIWKLKLLSRKEAYKWLSEKLGTPIEYTHIGCFNPKTCTDVVYYSKQFLNDMRRLDLDFGAEPVTPYYEI